jgi:membrane associated rhomboid family serine protease
MVTIAIIIITVITSLLAFSNQNILRQSIFNPYVIQNRNQYYRFLTSGLIHADFFHLAFNMYAFYLFGRIVELSFSTIFPGFGELMYISLYVSGLIMSQTYSFFKHREDPRYNALGASGAVSAVIFCSILLYPTQGIMIFPIPFFIPAYVFGPLYLFYSWYMSKRGMDNIGHDAHFFGALWGILFILLSWYEVIPHFFQQLTP